MATVFSRTIILIILIISTSFAANAQSKQSKTAPSDLKLPVTRRANLNVNLNNGNFSVSFVDFSFFSDPLDLGLSRTYNSRSNYEGLFGYGWSSNLDTYLEFLPDGSILLREAGGGRTEVFVPSNKQDFAAEVEELIQRMKTKETARSETYWTNVKKQAMNDEFYRRALFRNQFPSDEKYLKGKSWVLRSGQAGTLNREGKGDFKLQRPNTSTRHFDDKGNLIRVADPVSKAYLSFKWEKKRLKQITDMQGRSVQFTSYTPDGQIKKAVFINVNKNKIPVSYTYSKQGVANRLMSVTDGYGNEFKYAYRADGNLVEIGYHDKTADQIVYGKKRDWVERVKSWNGAYVDYKFTVDSTNPLKQSVSTQLFNSNGKPVGVLKKNVYEFKRRSDGSLYMAELKEIIGKSITQTKFNECCQLPTQLVVNGVTSDMKYDEQGRLLQKKDPTGLVKFTYNGRDVSPASVVRNGVTFTYEHEKAGVNRAKGPIGEVAISYDDSGRINELRNVKRGSTLKFTYNKFGQPQKIEQENFGAINFKYNAYGELGEMVPTSFKDEISDIMVATKITSSYQDFLNLMLPTRVSTNPEMQLSLGVLTERNVSNLL
jgi:hypothetical protein